MPEASDVVRGISDAQGFHGQTVMCVQNVLLRLCGQLLKAVSLVKSPFVCMLFAQISIVKKMEFQYKVRAVGRTSMH